MAGNAADLSGAVTNPDGIVVVDAIAPSVLSAAYGPHDGLVTVGETVSILVAFSEAVFVAGGSPTLLLNTGGIATYSGGSGTGTLTFDYLVGAGESSPDLAIVSLNLGPATIRDAAGRTASATVGVLVPHDRR